MCDRMSAVVTGNVPRPPPAACQANNGRPPRSRKYNAAKVGREQRQRCSRPNFFLSGSSRTLFLGCRMHIAEGRVQQPLVGREGRASGTERRKQQCTASLRWHASAAAAPVEVPEFRRGRYTDRREAVGQARCLDLRPRSPRHRACKMQNTPVRARPAKASMFCNVQRQTYKNHVVVQR